MNLIENDRTKNLWFIFYTYVRIPVNIAMGVIFLIGARNNLEEFFLWLIILILMSIVLLGLYLKSLLAWYLNFVLLIIESLMCAAWQVSQPSNSELSFRIALSIVVLIWLIPNSIYFYKRRYWFGARAKNISTKSSVEADVSN